MGVFQLRFTGLCAFVPNDNVSATRARVLLVDAQMEHIKHYPVLIAFESTWHGRPYQGTFRDANDNLMAYTFLSEQDLWIVGAGANDLNIIGQGDEADCPPQDDEDTRKHFGWVAPMHKINQPTNSPPARYWGTVDPRCLVDSDVAKSVAARVSLTDGTLTTLGFSADDEKSIVKWRFQVDPFDVPIDHVQALAEEVQLEFIFDTTEIALGGRIGIHTKAPQDLDPILLKPLTGDSVQAWVANMPWEMIISRKYDEESFAKPVSAPRSKLAKKIGKRDPDYHFMHFYQLLDTRKGNRIPYPEEERCDGDSDPSVDNPKCPPVQLAAQKNA